MLAWTHHYPADVRTEAHYNLELERLKNAKCNKTRSTGTTEAQLSKTP